MTLAPPSPGDVCAPGSRAGWRCSTTRCPTRPTTTPTRCTGSCATTRRSTTTPRRDLWVVSRYEDVTRVPAQPRADGQRAGQRHGRRPTTPTAPGNLIALDQPHHTRAAQRRAALVRAARDRRHGGPRPAGDAANCWPRCASGAGGRLRARSSRCRWCSASRCGSSGAPDDGPRLLAGAPAALDGAHRGRVRDPRRRRGAPTARPRSTSPRSCASARGRSRPAPGRRPDVISQILLAGAEGRARRGGAGRAGPPDAVRVHRRTRRAAHQLRRGAGQVPGPAGLPARQPRRWSRTSSRRPCATTARRRTCAARPPPRSPSPGSPSRRTPGSWC